MTEHSQRLIKQVNNFFKSYLEEKIDEEALLNKFEPIAKCFEDKEILNEMEKFISIIEDARFMYKQKEGRKFLSEEIKKILRKYIIKDDH